MKVPFVLLLSWVTLAVGAVHPPTSKDNPYVLEEFNPQDTAKRDTESELAAQERAIVQLPQLISNLERVFEGADDFASLQRIPTYGHTLICLATWVNQTLNEAAVLSIFPNLPGTLLQSFETYLWRTCPYNDPLAPLLTAPTLAEVPNDVIAYFCFVGNTADGTIDDFTIGQIFNILGLSNAVANQFESILRTSCLVCFPPPPFLN